MPNRYPSKRRPDMPPYPNLQEVDGDTQGAGVEGYAAPPAARTNPNHRGTQAELDGKRRGSDCSFLDNSYKEGDYMMFLEDKNTPRSVFSRTGYVPNKKPGVGDATPGGGW